MNYIAHTGNYDHHGRRLPLDIPRPYFDYPDTHQALPWSVQGAFIDAARGGRQYDLLYSSASERWGVPRALARPSLINYLGRVNAALPPGYAAWAVMARVSWAPILHLRVVVTTPDGQVVDFHTSN